MNAFSRLSPSAQWVAALLLAALCLAILGVAFVLPFLDLRLLVVSLLLVPLIAPLESLLLTPLYRLSGRFRYYSPLLFATHGAGGTLDLHVGTLFDYVMRLEWSDRGSRAAHIVMEELLRGLLVLCEEVESGTLPPDTEIVVTSYFFSDRTLARLGFVLRPPPTVLVHNLVMASLSIALRLSFTRGRFTFPNLRQIRQATTTAGQLARHKDTIKDLLQRFT